MFRVWSESASGPWRRFAWGRRVLVASAIGALGALSPAGVRSASAEDSEYASLCGVVTSADGVQPLGGARFILMNDDAEESRVVQCDRGSGRFQVVVKHGLFRVSELGSPVAGVAFPVVRAIRVTGDREVRLPFRGARGVRVVPRVIEKGRSRAAHGARLFVDSVRQGDRLALWNVPGGDEAGVATAGADGSFSVPVGDDPVQCTLELAGYRAPPVVLSPESPSEVEILAYPTRELRVAFASDVEGQSGTVEIWHVPTGASGSFSITSGGDPEQLPWVPVGELKWKAWFSGPGESDPTYADEGVLSLTDGSDTVNWQLDTRRRSFPASASASILVAAGWGHRSARVVLRGAPPVAVALESAADGSLAGRFVIPLRRSITSVPIGVSPFGWVTVLRVDPDGTAEPVRVPPPRDITVRFVADGDAETDQVEVAWTSSDASGPGGDQGALVELRRASLADALALKVPVGTLRLSASAGVLRAPESVIRVPESDAASETMVRLLPMASLRISGELAGVPIPIGGWTIRVRHGGSTRDITVHPSGVECWARDLEPGPVEVECYPPAGFRSMTWGGVLRAGTTSACVLRLR